MNHKKWLQEKYWKFLWIEEDMKDNFWSHKQISNAISSRQAYRMQTCDCLLSCNSQEQKELILHIEKEEMKR